MTQLFVRRKPDVLEYRSIEADADTQMGVQVELNSDNEFAVTSDADKAIGILDNMPDKRAENNSGTLPAGEMGTIALFGITFYGISSGTFNAGEYVAPSAGKMAKSATATGMIALTTSTATGQDIEYLVK